MTESQKKFYCHPSALVEADDKAIGNDTRIWAFVHILSGAKIGENCNICDHVFIENDVVLGDNATIKSGVQLWDGITIEDDVFVGPNATFANDKYPRSKHYPEKFLKTVIMKGASIGANATILPGLTIGTGAMVGAGAVVTRDIPSKAIVVGNPARIVGYADTKERYLRSSDPSEQLERSKVKGVGIYRLEHVKDMRGDLSAIEWGEDQLPFTPKRTFFVYNVPNSRVRGEHAHKVCHQFLLCLNGSVAVVVDDGENREEFLLNEPHIGIHIPPYVWGTQYKYSNDAVLFVLASHSYDAKDYIRNYEEYLAYLK